MENRDTGKTSPSMYKTLSPFSRATFAFPQRTLLPVSGSRSAARLTRTCWPKSQDVIYPANPSSSPLPWGFLEPPLLLPLHCSSGPSETGFAPSLFEAQNKKSKKISRKEAEKKRSSKNPKDPFPFAESPSPQKFRGLRTCSLLVLGKRGYLALRLLSCDISSMEWRRQTSDPGPDRAQAT
uniref:Agouti-signaling protein isoform X1 n=1 Tax=Tursiops truncatus TaxID=9739 RepID=A0A2U4CLA7_TURTR|nr:agouti-signaling protein isoform X1 [Tursiops truncatus]